MIRHKFNLKNAFQEMLYLVDNWINEGSGWIVESIKSQYINISVYRPLSGSSYLNLPVKIRSSIKGLINVKNKDQKCFLWFHDRYINPSKEHPERIKKTDKKVAEKLDYDEIEFPVPEKDFSKIEKIYIFVLMYLVMKMGWFFQFTFQIKNLRSQWIFCF